MQNEYWAMKLITKNDISYLDFFTLVSVVGSSNNIISLPFDLPPLPPFRFYLLHCFYLPDLLYLPPFPPLSFSSSSSSSSLSSSSSSSSSTSLIFILFVIFLLFLLFLFNIFLILFFVVFVLFFIFFVFFFFVFFAYFLALTAASETFLFPTPWIFFILKWTSVAYWSWQQKNTIVNTIFFWKYTNYFNEKMK